MVSINASVVLFFRWEPLSTWTGQLCMKAFVPCGSPSCMVLTSVLGRLSLPCMYHYTPLQTFLLRFGKTGNENVQFVLQHQTLHVYHPRIKPVLQQIKSLRVSKGCCSKQREILLFPKKYCTCHAFYRSKANLFCIK